MELQADAEVLQEARSSAGSRFAGSRSAVSIRRQLQEHILERRPCCTRSSAISIRRSSSRCMSIGARPRGRVAVANRACVPSHVEPSRRREPRKRRRDRAADGRPRARPTARRSTRAIELARRAGGDDAAAIDDRDAVAERFGLVEIVRRQQHRVAVVLHPRDLAVQLAARLRIETGGRLVEEDELGLVDEGQRQREPLPLAARQRVERRVGLVGEGEALEQRGRRRRCRGRTTPNSASASRGVILSCSAVVCSAAPIFCLTSRGRRRASMPQTSIAPASGSRRPMTHSTVVVLPAPFGPSSPKISPSSISKLTPRAASTCRSAS